MTSGTTTDPAPARRGSDFAVLSRQIKQAGLLRRRHGYYAALIAVNLLALAAGWTAFALLGDTWWQLLVAVYLAVASTHVAFVGHDAGHGQILRGRRANDAIGHVHAALVGVSYGWWVGKHNRHHANPNHEDEDPDLAIVPLAFTTRDAEASRGLHRLIVRHQAFWFFPLLLLEGLALHAAGARAAFRKEVPAHRLERVLVIGHLVGYLTAVYLVLPPLLGTVFIIVHKGLWGVYMGCSFAPNHKGMPTLSAGHTLDFLRKQVLTSRNIRGGPWVDFALGGLNYQVEHHLFPNMPRPHLRHAQAIVAEYCRTNNIPYTQVGLLRSYREVLRHMHAVGAPARTRA